MPGRLNSRRRRPADDRPERGFTFIEVVVVALILGMTAALVYPRLDLDRVDRRQLDQAAGRLAAVAVLAADRATYTRRDHFLVLDLDAGAYWIEVATATDRLARVDDAPDLGGDLPTGFRFGEVWRPGQRRQGEGTVRLRMTPDGWADPAVVELVAQDGDVALVTIEEVAGRVDTRSGDQG